MANLQFKYSRDTEKPLLQQAVLFDIEEMIDLGLIEGPIESAVVDILFDDTTEVLTAVIDDHYMIDHLQAQDIASNTDLYQRAMNGTKNYSVRTISERLSIQELPLLNQVRYLIIDYRRYYKTRLKEFIEDPSKFYQLRSMFINDMMQYYTALSPRMTDGENISKILGLSKIAAKTLAAGRKLAIIYKKIAKTGGITKDTLLRGQMAFKEFIDALCDQVFKGWREKIAGEQPLDSNIEEGDATEIVDDTEVLNMDDINTEIEESKTMSTKWNEIGAVVLMNADGTHEVVSIQDESDEDRVKSYVEDEGAKIVKRCKNTKEADEYIKSRKLERAYSDTLNGEEPEGEVMEYTPAEEELLHRESELAGDGKRIYSANELPKIEWKSIDKLPEEILDYNSVIDISKAKQDGYTKYHIFELDDNYNKVVSSLASVGVAIYPMSHFYPATAKIHKIVLVLASDEQAAKFDGTPETKQYSSLPKLEWGYTKDLIKQKYDNPHGGLSLEDIKKVYKLGGNKFYMFDNSHDAAKYHAALKEKSTENDEGYYSLQEVDDVELGKVWVLFASSKLTKNFSNSMSRF